MTIDARTPPVDPPQILVSVFPQSGAAASIRAVHTYTVRQAIDQEAARLIDGELAVEMLAIPIACRGRQLTVAMLRPDDVDAQRRIGAATGLRIRPVVASVEEIRAAIAVVYGLPLPALPPTRPDHQVSLGDLLRQEHLITEEQLATALAVQVRTRERLGKILVSLGYINRLTLGRTLARQLHLPFDNLLQRPPTPHVVRLLDEATARRLQAVPIRADASGVTVASSEALTAAARREIEAILGRSVHYAITGEDDVQAVLARVYREDYIARSTVDLAYRHPEESAHETFTTIQLAWILALLVATLAGFIAVPLATLITLNVIATSTYVAFSGYRLYLMYRGATNNLTVTTPPDEVAALKPEDLPFYTILVPLYREKEVLSTLIRALAALDYEPTKLEVVLLFEEDDRETLEAAMALDPPAQFRFVVVPDSEPRTKPKACNYGLIRASGQYCVIFDAEDIPEPDQLKKAVVAFQRVGDSVVCLQAKLNYYNANQNLLTRWFTSEYSMWFDLVLPGLDAGRVPVPLGGTSNHFVTEKLRALGAWDPFNVTEDADLGVRLHKSGYRTAVLDSTTYEEANSNLHNWIRQRSRWVKGYMQTWLVQMRHPIGLWRALGPRGFLSFQMTVGGTPLLFLLNPIYWVLTALWFLSHWDIVDQMFPFPVYFMGLFCLFIGNFVFMYVNVAGCMMRNQYPLVRYALFTPLYWMLMSIAAWRAAYQLVFMPFYWEKTVHGLHLKHMTPGATPDA